MATKADTFGSKITPPKRVIIVPLVLLGILVITGVLLTFNYWWAVGFGFVSLLFLWRFGLEEHEARGLLLLLTSSLCAAVAAGSITLPLSANASVAITVGIIAFLGVIVFFLMLVAVATLGILKWHKKDQSMSMLKAFGYMLTGLLGLLHFSVIVEDGQIKGSDGDKERLAKIGGPGWLTVYPGQVVVLHDWGKITRVVGQGSTMLKREEQIKAIVPLGGKGGTSQINVLTRDRIPLKITFAHVVQVEPAKETATRLPGPHGKEVGDEYDQCHEDIAKLVATKVAVKEDMVDIWEAMKVAIVNNMKDVIMSCDFDEIFDAKKNGQDLAGSVNDRKIVDIENTVLARVKDSGLGRGLVLRVVDINEVHFSEKMENEIMDQVTHLVNTRIENLKAQAAKKTAEIQAEVKGIEAKSSLDVAEQQANIIRKLAEAEAEANKMKEEARLKVRLEHYKDIMEKLKGDQDASDVARIVLENVSASAVLEDELKRLLELIVHYIRSEHTAHT